jgi:hypothetical protein
VTMEDSVPAANDAKASVYFTSTIFRRRTVLPVASR